MTAANFQTFYDFIEQPDNDGQPFHITEGDPGGATVYGWTEVMWNRVATLHGIQDVSLAAFKSQTKTTLQPLTRGQYWNGIQGDRLPPGFDVFWADFQFGSGRATKVLQGVLGTVADGVVGMATLARLMTEYDKPKLMDRFLGGRLAYYDSCGFKQRWPGLYRRAKASHALGQSLIAGQAPKALG